MEYLLYENINGYYLFTVNRQETLNDSRSAETYENLGKLSQIIQLKSKFLFPNISSAYENYESLNRNILPDMLLAFLDINEVSVLHCDPSLFININNFGIRTRFSPLIIKGIRANEDKLLNQDINEKFRVAANNFIAHKASNYTFKNESYLINQYYTALLSFNTKLNKTFQTVKILYTLYFPEIKEKRQTEFIKILKIIQNFHKDDIKTLKIKSEESKIPLNILKETLGVEIDWNLIKQEVKIFDCLIEEIKSTEKVLETKITKIFPLSIKLIPFKSLASLLSKVGYDEIPLLSIEKLKKLCPFDKKKNQKN
ncbi:Nucleolar protein 56, partial [Cucumispora dikerogammari]